LNFNSASQPYYIQMTAEGKLLNSPIQYTDKKTFESWLLRGLEQLDKLVPKANYFTY